VDTDTGAGCPACNEKCNEMNQAPQFYTKVVALNDEKHRGLRIRSVQGYAFARDTNAVVLTAAEFAFAALEYPVVFLDVAGRVTPIAVLGLEPAQNLFLGNGALWEARYVPAYVRRYPFMLARATPAAREMTVCIDESSDRLSQTDGERLFQDDGNPTAYLTRAIEFLRDYDRQARITEELCARLAASTLLEPMQANLSLPDGVGRSVGGFLAVSRDRLKALGAEQVYALLDKGELELIYSHLFSLRNFAVLADRRKGGGARPGRHTAPGRSRTKKKKAGTKS
jgi:hypothetical protein